MTDFLLPKTLSVSELNTLVKHTLEYQFSTLSVEGEISNLVKPSSGHYYFTLKDHGAQVRCVYFKNHHTSQPLAHGNKIIVTGQLSLYEPRGDYQLIVQKIETAGIGELFRQFEALKVKLAALGLFNENRKKPIPKFPKAIGVITSASGAALRDILITLKRRYPLCDVFIYPTEVQGTQAHLQIIKALKQAFSHQCCDTLILARGGGSYEDLWAFNQEALIYALAESSIPIITGIGHETDVTLADFIADVRAATPTAAAEAATPDQFDLIPIIKVLSQRLNRSMTILRTHWQTSDRLRSQLMFAMQKHIAAGYALHHVLHHRLIVKNPRVVLQQHLHYYQQLHGRLLEAMHSQLKNHYHHFQKIMASMNTVSPLATLKRGYSIATHQHQVLTNASTVEIGDNIQITLHQGNLVCTIVEKQHA